jgi:UDP-N-acetylglucosamine 2-epimerase (hydrolysing)
MGKKIVFLSGTRADFGKIKSLIQILENHQEFEPYIFVTGMHLIEKYGYTLIEIERCNFSNVIYKYINHETDDSMDKILSSTMIGFSQYIKQIKPDLIIVHGDRVEALAGAIVGSLNNILVGHIEGGEVSGTIDELIRHSVTKMSHVHFVANEEAKKRLIQLGEFKKSIFTIGSPDIDLMGSKYLPDLEVVKKHYNVTYKDYSIAMFHPVTTEYENIKKYAGNFVNVLIDDTSSYVVIYPNNDLGSELILKEYKRLENNPRFRIIPSIRFEYFLTLLKNSKLIVGNSSTGIREAPYYGIPTINIGTRQENRSVHSSIINTNYFYESIKKGLSISNEILVEYHDETFGKGNSAELFLKSLAINSLIWKVSKQKQFIDL